MHMILCCFSRTILIPNNRRYIRWEMPKRHCAENYKLWSNCGFCVCVWEFELFSSSNVTRPLPIRSLTSAVGGESSCFSVFSLSPQCLRLHKSSEHSLLNKMDGLMWLCVLLNQEVLWGHVQWRLSWNLWISHLLSTLSVSRFHTVWITAAYSDKKWSISEITGDDSACVTWKPHTASCPRKSFCTFPWLQMITSWMSDSGNTLF